MAYTYGYIKKAALQKLDMTEEEALRQNLIDGFFSWSNEVITQICSAIKPYKTYADFEVTLQDFESKQKNYVFIMPTDFISFDSDINYILRPNGKLEQYQPCYFGYNKLMITCPGVYKISYNARWYTFTIDMSDETLILTADNTAVPEDVLDCIPSYIASQAYKIDNETKAQIYRNEYEIMLARINNTSYQESKRFEYKW